MNTSHQLAIYINSNCIAEALAQLLHKMAGCSCEIRLIDKCNNANTATCSTADNNSQKIKCCSCCE